MRSLLMICLIGFTIIGVNYWYLETAHLCPVPISYRVGMVDQRFDVSSDLLKRVALNAETAWEKATSRELFVYDETSSFTIDLIYDERQQWANTEEEWRIALDEQLKGYQKLVADLKAEQVRYESVQTLYNKEREEYEQKLNAYNTKVETYNQAGGAPPAEYESLRTEAERLNKMLDALLKTEVTLAAKAEAVNQLGEQGNRLIEAYNGEVEKYNAVYGKLTTFTQGEYERASISVYKFTDEAELTRVLVHEFGHALGIGHVEDEGSAMYYLMAERDPTTLSDADLAAFIAVCGAEPSLVDHFRRIIRTILAT